MGNLLGRAVANIQSRMDRTHCPFRRVLREEAVTWAIVSTVFALWVMWKVIT